VRTPTEQVGTALAERQHAAATAVAKTQRQLSQWRWRPRCW